ncbi:outer membrane protein OmpH-like family protein [Asticcacaulis biprosthecium C19]|uniref:Outer membrane protein OmpH-like family protein n=1 Tax=Asticcacaulis biprosthecium C19 TaxID=715226 RepID=F4QQM4_9CAUL|nr:OmpH family outer membrane protein [Asticcacaulis biprosthecium]EGF90511.1 outer membrane protein OmpH-like family protein [Asticcacaulis biprosthecium C19]
MTKTSLVALAGVLALTAAGQAFAQTSPTPPTFGAAIPGQCVLDTGKALADSKLGQQANARLAQLQAQVKAELTGESEALQAEEKQLQDTQKTATATEAGKKQWEGKVQAWAQKGEIWQRKVQLREEEMRYTTQIAINSVMEKMIPQINTVVTQKQCSMVVRADGLLQYQVGGPNNQSQEVLYVNPAMDITASVVQKMDASGEQLPQINRVNLEQQAAQAQAAQGAPAQKK